MDGPGSSAAVGVSSGMAKRCVDACFAAKGSPASPSPRFRSARDCSHSSSMSGWTGSGSRLSRGSNRATGIEDVSRIGRLERNWSTCRSLRGVGASCSNISHGRSSRGIVSLASAVCSAIDRREGDRCGRADMRLGCLSNAA
jgi:hypothetical protein